MRKFKLLPGSQLQDLESGEKIPLIGELPVKEEYVENIDIELKYEILGLMNGKDCWFAIRKQEYDILPSKIHRRLVAYPLQKQVAYEKEWSGHTERYETRLMLHKLIKMVKALSNAPGDLEICGQAEYILQKHFDVTKDVLR
jgi:hypothetical protein